MTPGETIRAYCIECYGSQYGVENCGGDKQLDPKHPVCPFFPFRLGKGRPSVKRFRMFCLECMCRTARAVAEYPSKNCLCYPYRFGKNPNYEGKEANFHPEQRA